MGDKVLGIIVIFFGGIFLILGVNGIVSIPDEMKLAQSAVYLDEPKVLAENEGKIVIVSGKVECEPLVDEVTGVTLNTPVARRTVERYQISYEYHSDGSWEWCQEDDGDLTNTLLTGKANIGEFQIDKDLLACFSTGLFYEDFDPDELKAAKLYQHGSFYLSPDKDIPIMGHDSMRGLLGNGCQRIYYTYFSPNFTPDVTIIGYQQGNTLKHASFNNNDLYLAVEREGILSKKEFLDTEYGNMMLYSIGSSIFGLIGCGVGAYWILKKPRKREKQKCDKRK